MHRIIYTSIATNRMSSYNLVEIVQLSVRNNAECGITGFLIYRGGQFLQLVEGEHAELNKLIERLSRDDRHRSITIIHDEPVAARSFPNWRMKRLPSDGREALAELDRELEARGQRGLPNEVMRFLQQQAA